MEFDLSTNTMLILIAVAFFAGIIDSIAGGGGSLTIPALLLAGIPPHFTLGTNKLSACFGSFSATLTFWRKKHLSFKNHWLFILSSFVFSALGSIAVQFWDANLLNKFIPFLLIIFGFYFLFSPKMSDESPKKRVGYGILALFIGLVGFYDGFFGPGTGSFFIIVLISLGGYTLKSAIAHSKLFNFITNLASVLLFAASGYIIWHIGLFMAIGHFFGGQIGANLAIKHGIKIVKPLVVIVSLLASINLLFKEFSQKTLIEAIFS